MTRTRCIDNKAKTPEIRQIYPPGTTKTKSPVAFTKLNLVRSTEEEEEEGQIDAVSECILSFRVYKLPYRESHVFRSSLFKLFV